MKLKRERLFKAAIVVIGICGLLFYSGGLVSAQPAPLNCEGPCKCMDIVLVVDDTGSMGGAIANVKSGLADIIAAAQEASIGPIGAGGDPACLRMGLVTFKDDIEVDQALTDYMPDVVDAVNALSAVGGAGEPEASDEALRYVVTGAASADCTVTEDPDPLGPFRTNGTCEAINKIIVLVTDARPGGCDDLFEAADEANANAVAELAFAADPIVISAVFVPTDPNGIYFETIRPIMQYYATATGGVFSEVGGDGSGTGAAIEEIIAACGGPPGECAECPESPECPECDGLDPDAMREEFNEMRSYMEGLRESLRNRLRR